MSEYTGFKHGARKSHARKSHARDFTFSDNTNTKVRLQSYDENNAYHNVFQPHIYDENIFTHSNVVSTDEHVDFILKHTEDNIYDFVNETIGNVKQQLDIKYAQTEIVCDDLNMNKYSELANESYNHYEGKERSVEGF